MLNTAQKVAQILYNIITYPVGYGKDYFTMAQEKKITIDQVAQALGVSKTTVSRALSGKGRVGRETKERIFTYIRQSGGRLSGAQMPPEERTFNIALVIPSHFIQLDLPFLRKCMGGVCRMAGQRGYDVLLCYAESRNTQQLERLLQAGKVDGVILTRSLKQDPCVEMLKKCGMPFVVLGNQPDQAVMQVDNDQTTAAEEMTRLLIQQGMRRIAYMGGSLNYTVNADRLEGFTKAMEEAGLPLNPGLVFSDIESAEKRIDDLEAALEQKPECLLCCDDTLAFAVQQEVQKRGIRVPEQIRIASLYDSELLLHARPAISAVEFDAAALGTAACRMLLDSMAGKAVSPRIVHGHQVILRESTQ